MLSAIGICCLVLSICALVLANQFILDFEFNSDQLTVPSFAEDFLRNPHFSFFTWMYPRAPYAFPDFPVFLALRSLTGDSLLSVFIHSVFFVIALCVGAKLFLDCAVERERRFSAFIFFLALCSISLLFGSISESGILLLWQFMPFSHATAAVVSLYMARLWIKASESKDAWPHIAFVALCSLSIFSDKIFLIYFCLPAAIAIFVQGIRTGRRSKVVIYMMEVSLSFGLALIVDRSILLQPIDPMLDGWTQIKAIGAFIYSGPVPWIFCLVGIFFAIKICFGYNARDEDQEFSQHVMFGRYFLAAFTLLGMFLTVALWRDSIAAYGRYSVVLTLGVMLSLSVAISEIPRSLLRFTYIVPGASVIMLLWFAAPKFSSPMRVLEERLDAASALAECKSKFGLRTGFGSYWVARKVSMFTGWSPQINQFEPSYPRAFFWGNNYLWFFEDLATGKPSEVNFIVTNKLEIPDIRKLFGNEFREVDCGPYHIFVYDNPEYLRTSILNFLTRYNIIHSAKGHVIGISKSGLPPISLSLMASQTGRTGTSFYAAAPKDSPGFLMYGPYVDLPRGRYDARFTVSCKENRQAHSLDVSVDLGQKILVSKELSPHGSMCDGSKQSIDLRFKISKDVKNLELRAFFGGAGVLEVHDIALKAVFEN